MNNADTQLMPIIDRQCVQVTVPRDADGAPRACVCLSDGPYHELSDAEAAALVDDMLDQLHSLGR